MKMLILACGTMRDDAQKSLLQTYQKRLSRWKTEIKECTHKKDACAWLVNNIPDAAYVIALDERGKDINSQSQASIIKQAEQDPAVKTVVWIIGPADGLNDALRSRANQLLSFGARTWPHMLVRIMLVEQLYRTQEIILNNPYHREG